MKKILRITTVPSSLRSLLRGQHRFMNQHYKIIGISGDGDALKEVAENEGIETQIVEMSRAITPLKDLRATWKLYKIFRKEQPFIVHTHTPKAGTVGMLAAKMARVPHRIHTIAGLPLLEETGAKRKLLDTVEKITYSCATKILPNSYGLQTIILENGYTRKSKLRVIGKGSSNGINTAHYDPELISDEAKSELKKELNITTTDVVFIFIGRLVKDKGINELVAAFNLLSKTNSNGKLLLVGSQEDHLDPLQLETETIMNTHKQIICVGIQKDIRPYLAISDVLTFPSYREGFPNVVMESCSMGLPCIVSNINGCNEIIEHDYNGLIIPVKDQEALFSAMQNMIDHPDKRMNLARNSRPRIKERYEQSYVWEEMLTFYKSLEK